MIYLPSDTSDDQDSVSSLYPATKRLWLESEVSDEEIQECAEKVCSNIKRVTRPSLGRSSHVLKQSLGSKFFLRKSNFSSFYT
jgi:hypothetical protein